MLLAINLNCAERQHFSLKNKGELAVRLDTRISRVGVITPYTILGAFFKVEPVL